MLGTTLERKRHSVITIEAREVTKGGIPNAYGNRDTQHCLLDVLYDGGYLGSRDDAEVRHGAGMRLREMYYILNPTGTPLNEMGNHKDQFVKDIGTGRDLLESQYHRIMRMLSRYKIPAIKVCVEDRMVHKILCIDMLDCLWSALELNFNKSV